MKKQKKKKTPIPLRLNLLFFTVFILFSALIFRLGIVQIVYGSDYLRELQRAEYQTINMSVPRGKMYDRNLKPVVDNVPLNAITYTRYQKTKQKEMLETAKLLAQFITMETDRITVRDKQDFWLLNNPELAEKKLNKHDKQLAKKEKDKVAQQKFLYKCQLRRITEEEINSFTSQELEVLAIYREFRSGHELTPHIVKNKGVTNTEFATVSENLDILPGVDVTTDWDRVYKFDKTLKTVLGKVSSSKEGLPSDQLDYYLSRDYSMNDRVGKSYIEKAYEDVLHGQKTKMKTKKNKAGEVISSEQLSEGKRGKDLVLTIDMDLQLAVEKIIETELAKTKAEGNRQLLDRAFVVLMDPRTGELLTMAGKKYVVDEKTGKHSIEDFALGNITTSYTVGSSVKGATVLTGFKTGSIYPGQLFHDEKLVIKGTKPKGSYSNLGTLNDQQALKLSSNVYMFRTAIAIGGGNYVPNQPLFIDPKAFPLMRNSFSKFGLGARTGIDLPNESAGFKGIDTNPGLFLDLSIGQYDTYTPLQLAQYVSTIANGGKRMQPHIVKEIREPINENGRLGPLFRENSPVVMNTLDMEPEWISRVQEGFRQVVTGGTASRWFADKKYSPAGKTGTAQAFYDGPGHEKYEHPLPTINLTLVTYAPYDNPEVAMSVVVPWAYQGSSEHSLNKVIGEQVMDTYFALKQKRAKIANETDTAQSNQKSDQKSTADGEH
jgi:penicillin-binding protein A